MKNIEMIELYNRLNEFVQKDKVVPVKISYSISRNMSRIAEELKPYEEARIKLIEGFEEKSDEEKNKIEKELTELLMIDCNIDLFKIGFEDLERCEGLSTKEFTSPPVDIPSSLALSAALIKPSLLGVATSLIFSLNFCNPV